MPTSSDTVLPMLQGFYTALRELEVRCGGLRRLAACTRHDVAVLRGVYFFFEDGEERSRSGTGPRVVRVGTHALVAGASSTLWGRLKQHRGNTGGGNHRSSIFRHHVGGALINAGIVKGTPGWFERGKMPAAQRLAEKPIEVEVSRVIGSMRVLWLLLDDMPGSASRRGYVERNAIALLSSQGACALDPPSGTWLGHHARAPEMQQSGLWNVRHVSDPIDPGFLDFLTQRVRDVG